MTTHTATAGQRTYTLLSAPTPCSVPTGTATRAPHQARSAATGADGSTALTPSGIREVIVVFRTAKAVTPAPVATTPPATSPPNEMG
jgi:hypothetical protein